MINFKMDGIAELVSRLNAENLIPYTELDRVVESASVPIVNRIKENYQKQGHKVTGNLINSIQAFRRKRKGKSDPYFTYYVGAKYAGKNNLFAGGNHAHFLEYGVLYSSYPIKGEGKTIRGRKYGKFSSKQGYRVAPTRVIGKSRDEMEQATLKRLEKGVIDAIVKQAERKLK